MWIYNGTPVDSHADLLTGCTDFVYLITYACGRMYIGKKSVRAIRRLKPTKKQLSKRKNYVRKEWVDLPFAKYEGSSELTQGLKAVSKEILYQCSTKKAATYLEVALLMHHDALFDPDFINENISGTFFNSDLDGLLEP
jgi:hypothetical protein